MRATSKVPRAATAIKNSNRRNKQHERRPLDERQQAFVSGQLDGVRHQERAALSDLVDQVANAYGAAHAINTAVSSLLSTVRVTDRSFGHARHLLVNASEALDSLGAAISDLRTRVRS